MRTAKPPAVLDLAHRLRTSRTLNWPEVVRTASWLSGGSEQGVDWRDSIRDLPGLIAPIKDSLGLDAADPLSGYLRISYIAAAERKTGKPLNELGTTEELKTALDAFRESAPDLLFSLWSKNRVGKEQLRLVLLEVWRYTDHTAAWPARWWRRLFQETGFLSDGLPRPRHPITVYRGTRPEGRRGLSWTLHEHQAERFADYWWDHGYRHPPGHVYKVRVAPKNILAIISGHNKTLTLRKPPGVQKGIFDDQVAKTGQVRFGGEDEVIVDARRLKPVLLQTWKQRWVEQVREGVRDPEDLDLLRGKSGWNSRS